MNPPVPAYLHLANRMERNNPSEKPSVAAIDERIPTAEKL